VLPACSARAAARSAFFTWQIPYNARSRLL
jgi:hypothetical protein